MSQIQVSTEAALRETMIENEWRKSRIMILAQQLSESQAEVGRLKAQIEALEPRAEAVTT